MQRSQKNKILMFLGLLLLISIALSISLSLLVLEPGLPPPDLQGRVLVTKSMNNNGSMGIQVDNLFIIVVALIVVGALIYVIYQMIKGVPWKSLRKIIFNTIIGILLVSAVIIFGITALQHSKNAPSLDIVQMTPVPLTTAPLGQVPSWLLWIIGIGLAAPIVLVLGWIILSKQKEKGAISRVKLEAEKARRAVQSGGNLKDVIIQCYRQMSLALAEENGIEREEFITPREFENILNAAGFPIQPLEQLTSLFEVVRYGNWSPNQEDENLAIRCFEAIYQAAEKLKETSH